jgi:hypothetical protein
MRLGLAWLTRAERLRIGIPLTPHTVRERRVAMASRDALGLIMPASMVAIEYEHTGAYDVSLDYTHALATRRIALCLSVETEQGVDAHLMPEFVRACDDEGGILVWPITWHDEKSEWSFAVGAALVPRYQAREWIARLHLRGPARLHAHLSPPAEGPLTVRYLDLQPELITRLGPENVPRILEESCMDAVWAALGTFAAMGCANVSVRDGLPLVWRGRHCAPLDPFHGRPVRGLLGAWRWQQDVTSAPLEGLHRTRMGAGA